MERRGRATCVGTDQGQLATGGTRWSRRKAAAFKGRTSRISREAYVRSCERLGVQLPGPTRRKRDSQATQDNMRKEPGRATVAFRQAAQETPKTVSRRWPKIRPPTFPTFCSNATSRAIKRQRATAGPSPDDAQRLSRRPVAGPVVFGKMAPEVAAVVENAGYLDHAVGAAAVEEKMPGLFDAGAACPAPAQRNVVGPRAPDHDLGALLRAWPLGIGSYVL